MATVQDRINAWKTGEVRWANQVNNTVALNRYNKWLHLFQKELLEYVANQWMVTSVNLNTVAGRDTYSLPFNFNLSGASSHPVMTDFYSIAQLRVAYEEKNWKPAYRVCEPITISDYNITDKWYSTWEPYIAKRISKQTPRYSFVNKYEGGKTETHIKIYPTPEKSIANWISLSFNYINKPVELTTNEDLLWLPRYFFDAIEEYMTYKLIDIENPEMAMTYYQLFKETVHDNIYWLNRDQRPVEEEMADLRYLSHN